MKRIAAVLLLTGAAFGQTRGPLAEYALVLEDPPVAQVISSRSAITGKQAQAHTAKLRAAQAAVVAALGKRRVRVSATSQLLVNAVFVRVAGADAAAALKDLPGVKYVQFLPRTKPSLNAAINLVGVPAAWSTVGGSTNAGAGVRIGVIDTGIDQNHPGFQDATLTAPAGFPVGNPNFTNNKVIVARSYVSYLTDPDPLYSTPDDSSPRDRQGHGTAIAMIAAGVANTGPAAAITGVAPKAFLGNYKVFGSPGLNEYTYFTAWNAALTDAVTDRMDIVTLSLGEGDPAIFGPLDVGTAVCGDPICDVRSQAVESATKLGVLVVAAAGNGGDIGSTAVSQNSLNTPGVVPSAVTVGASVNSHALYQAVKVNGGSLGSLRALFGDGPKIAAPLTAPIKDVTQVGDNGQACAALPAGSLSGAIALIQRGTCYYSDKVNFAQAAGAVAVVLYQSAGIEDITARLYVQDCGIPAAMIGSSDGVALKSYLSANSNAKVTLDPALSAVNNSQVNAVAGFSSRGPSIGNFANTRDFALKPELVAPGTGIYTATQSYDPNADTYNATGYTTVSGTSFAVPFVAGVAALAKAANPNLNTPGRLKSAVVNTATADLAGTVHVTDAGAGKLNAADAVKVAATLEPAAISFGPVTALPSVRNLVVTNVSGAAATFSIAVRQLTSDSSARVTVSTQSFSLQSGGSQAISVTLQGSKPAPGSYEGFLDVTGAGPALHLPYLYLVGSGVPYNVFAVQGSVFTGVPNDYGWRLAFRVVDSFGVPVANTPVGFQLQSPGEKFDAAGGDRTTDILGNAAVWVDLGPTQGPQIFTGTASGLTQEFDGYVRRLPAIQSGGVVNAGPPYAGNAQAPGSYISIFGTDLSDASAVETTPYLPVSLAQVSVSFDRGGLSVPGHLHFVSPGQINVQVPWEFQGQPSVQMKVTLYGCCFASSVYTVPLTTYSPGVFAITDASGVPISAANPAKRGQAIVIYANGLGPVDLAQSSGNPASSTALTSTLASPAVTIGGSAGVVQFSGMTPGLVGLYQVNVQVAGGTPTGTQALSLSIGGATATVNVVVQ